MYELSELETRILSELEEAGEEDLVTMMLTVAEATGDWRDVEEMQSALDSLVRLDLVRISMDRDTSGRLRELSTADSLEVIADLKSRLHFDSKKAIWVNARRTGPPFDDPFPYIVNTEAGKEKGFEILNARGYQWWRPKR